MRLMLVDDERRVLDGLERLIHVRRPDVEVRSFVTASAALEALLAQPFDVVVTDMRMPIVDGAQLLAVVHERHPTVVRIVLSGQMEDLSAMRATEHAHVFLMKPCASDLLDSTLAQATTLREILLNPTLRAAVPLSDLPPLPIVYRDIQRRLGDRQGPVPAVLARLAATPGVRSQVLVLAQDTVDPTAAARGGSPEVVLGALGLKTLQAVVLIANLIEQAHYAGPPVDLDELAARIHRTARAAAAVGRGDPAAIMAALLAHVGELVLATCAPALAAGVRDAMAAGAARLDAERAVCGFDHTELAAYVLGIWGLPLGVIDAVRAHHTLKPHAGNERLAAIAGVSTCVAEGGEPDVAGLTALVGAADAASLVAAARAANARVARSAA